MTRGVSELLDLQLSIGSGINPGKLQEMHCRMSKRTIVNSCSGVATVVPMHTTVQSVLCLHSGS